MKKAIVLLSGGLDSAVVLGMALHTKRECWPLAFDYGQRHIKELQSAYRIVQHYSSLGLPIMSMKRVTLGGLDFSSSALTSDLDIPSRRDVTVMDKEIPVTYVPSRNSIFLSIGAAFAEAVGADEVWAGMNALGLSTFDHLREMTSRVKAGTGLNSNDERWMNSDPSGYPDCTPEFVTAMQSVLDIGTKRGAEGKRILLVAPIIRMSKSDIVRKGQDLGVPMGMTWSCFAGDKVPCRSCDSCVLRERGFTEAGLLDPAT